MWIDITWSNVVFWRWRSISTTGEFKSYLTNSNNRPLRKVKLLDVKWSDKKMIYHLIFHMDPATLSQLRKKKLCCVLVLLTKTNAICKLKNDDRVETLYIPSFDGDNFETIASSTCEHDSTYGLANYRGSVLTTGSNGNLDCKVKTEVYNFESNQWDDDYPDYPYSS